MEEGKPMVIAMGVSYRGDQFHGWESQQDACVRSHLESAISQVANEPLQVACAGRTDRGVHALMQVVSFETTATRDDHNWVRGVNTFLPPEVRVMWARAMPGGFHARFSAAARRYAYVIHQTDVLSAVLMGLVTPHQHHAPLDIDAMREASRCLIGEQDFSAFRASGCQSQHARREIFSVKVMPFGRALVIEIEGNAFLYHMIRNIVGSLLYVGSGVQNVAWFREVLLSQDRTCAGPTAPPDGLYFMGVRYAEIDELLSMQEVSAIISSFALV